MLRICSRGLVKLKLVRALHSGRTLTQYQTGVVVPPLQQSCEVLLSSLQTYMDAEELKQTKELMEEFVKEGGIGERLQRGLERRAGSTENWITDHYMEDIYLNIRKPLVCLSNVGILFPRMDFTDKAGQIRCAAELIAAALDLKTMIDNDTLPADHMNGKLQCMNQYKLMMSSCRLPGPNKDSILFYDLKHITVVHNCQFFVLEVQTRDGTWLTVDQLCVQLDRICSSSPQTNMDSVGILTTEHRDIWNRTYINLLKDETNRQSVSAIQSSIFTVCLDGAMPADELNHRRAGFQVLHGGGSRWNSGNRWFDKSIQLIIGNNGTLGLNFSHATADGTTIISMADYMVAGMKKQQAMKEKVLMEPLPMPQKLHFNITTEIQEDIEKARQHLDRLAQAVDLRVSVCEHVGKEVVKAHKMSPDAFVQMALQLAYYRIHQRFCPSLEPISQRSFRNGRLGSVQSNSPASAAFVKAFDDPQKQKSEKLELLQRAMKTHRWYTELARTGQDFEHHFWGLFRQAAVDKISLPDVITDVVKNTLNYRLIASNVMSRCGCVSVVAPEVPGSVTVVYSLLNHHMELVVSTMEASNSSREADAGAMMQAIEDALLDMRTLLEQTARAQK